MIGVIGPDGVGKSTLLALIVGRAQDPAAAMSRSSTATWRTSAHRRRELRPHRLHAAGAWPQSLSDAQRLREHRLLRPLVRPGRRRAPSAHRRAAQGDRARPVRRTGRRQALRRHEAEAQPLLRADPRSRPAHSRRADDRRRSALAPAVLGPDRHDPRPAAAA